MDVLASLAISSIGSHFFNPNSTHSFRRNLYRTAHQRHAYALLLCHRYLYIQRYWTAYYKWLQHGRWSWLALAQQFVRLVLKQFKNDIIYLAIDDTLTLRKSKKAPGSQIHHQHGSKPNLAKTVTTLILYGKQCTVRYRSKRVLVKFLNGQQVRVVWCELKNSDGRFKPMRLFLSTDTSLSAEEILTSYGYRWSI